MTDRTSPETDHEKWHQAISRLEEIADDDAHGRYGRLAQEALEHLTSLRTADYAQTPGQPIGYLIPKSGVDNGYYFLTVKDAAHVEERFKHLYTPVFTSPDTSTLQSAPDLPAIQLKVIEALRDSTCFGRDVCQSPPCPCTHDLAKMIASCALPQSSPIHGGSK